VKYIQTQCPIGAPPAGRQRKLAIAAYAAEMAGTEFDLDPELEAVSLDLLFENEPAKARPQK
jgi:hypothetical protein